MDENEGKGGSYVIDPKTGLRRLVERTEELPQTGMPADEARAPEPMTEEAEH